MPRGGAQTEWTTADAEIAYRNRFEAPKLVNELLPHKTRKSVKNSLYKARAITEEIEQYILEHYTNEPAPQIDKKFGILVGSTAFYLKAHDFKRVWRDNSYTAVEMEAIEKYCGIPGYTHAKIAKMLNVSPNRVRNLASKMGIPSAHRLSKEIRNQICEEYSSGDSISLLAERYDKTSNGIRNILYRMGVYRNDQGSSFYNVNKCESFIMTLLEENLEVSFPDKSSKENREYYWGIIPPYEVDIPFEIDGIKFAIEYDGEFWHRNKKEIDLKKEQLLKEQGYWFWRISSDDHNERIAESLKPLIMIIIQSINQILLKERSTTIPDKGREIRQQE